MKPVKPPPKISHLVIVPTMHYPILKHMAYSTHMI